MHASDKEQPSALFTPPPPTFLVRRGDSNNSQTSEPGDGPPPPTFLSKSASNNSQDSQGSPSRERRAPQPPSPHNYLPEPATAEQVLLPFQHLSSRLSEAPQLEFDQEPGGWSKRPKVTSEATRRSLSPSYQSKRPKVTPEATRRSLSPSYQEDVLPSSKKEKKKKKKSSPAEASLQALPALQGQGAQLSALPRGMSFFPSVGAGSLAELSACLTVFGQDQHYGVEPKF